MKRKILIIVVLFVVILLLRNSPLATMFSFENLINSKGSLLNYVNQHYVLSVVMFILIYFVVTGFSLPGAAILTITAGALYGNWQGALIVNVGATAGATAAFLVARYLLGNSFQEKYKEQLEKFNRELSENGTSYMFSLRLIPVFPFFVINLLSGLTALPIRKFIWTTSLGILPGSFVYSNAGRQLSKISSVKEIFTFEMLLAFILLGSLSLIPVLIKKMKRDK